MLAEEPINTVGKGLRILPIDVDDQRRTLLVAVLNHERDILEFIRLSIRLEFIGDLVGQVVEYLNRFLCHRLNFALKDRAIVNA
ncbi:hypothetical protein [Haloarcula sp. 1CSR25-25]|uniref:hypothetical protein n=1 Tax=Haloarcula sp. 1CSR25-25 TaxID=2862545 RepID=UPI0028942743|nr:hypothetical protein [Haloarcula sp. 1CSR25-25]MDT3437418.1 hypothetical protein [Haloarcula sp. 1CSR25-25]